MKDFMFKLDRCIWLAFLNQDKIYEAYESFNNYLGNLYKHKRKPEVKEEIEFTQKLFYTTLFEKNKIYLEKEDYSNALLTSNIMFNIDKFHVDAIKNYIKALAKTNQKDLCIDMIEYLKTITNDDKSIYKYFAEIFNEIKDYENAIKYMKEFIDSKQEYEVLADEYNLLGYYYNLCYNETFEFDKIESALENFKLAYKKYPTNKLFLKNICIILGLMNRRKEEHKYWKEILNIGELFPDEAFEYSAYSLKIGDFKNFYKYYDARFEIKNLITFPKLKGVKWNDNFDVSNSRLLVYFEQGFGDTILISGFMKKLKSMCKKVLFVVQDELYQLLKNNNYDIDVYPASNVRVNTLEFDYWIPAFNVLNLLNIGTTSCFSDTNFINLNKEKIKLFKNMYFNNNKLKIGISCFGKITGNRTRDLPHEYLKELDKIENAEFYILNKDFDDKYLPKNSKNKFINLGKFFNNFEDTAMAIENCDFIISTDNCILNLAGLLGKKTYALFNWCYEFRWFNLSGKDVIWYKSVKPFVNEKMNDWAPTIQNVIDIINAGNPCCDHV